MNKIDKMLSSIDRKVDRKFSFIRRFFKKYFPIFSAIFLGILIFTFVIRVFYTRPSLIASIIEDDIKLIALALEKIDARCSILSIDDERNEVDFLQIHSFVGSSVGPFNLAYPDCWEGPYLNVNPTIKGKHYEILKAADGIFIVPGMGVPLPNGRIVGKDFELSSKTRIGDLLRDKGDLRYEDKKFAVKLIFKIGDRKQWHLKEKTVKKIDRLMREFNEAMPYTKNKSMGYDEPMVLR
jgi:hypothetical protein